MALSCDTKPDFTTIADFESISTNKEIVHLFREVLLVCDDLGLVSINCVFFFLKKIMPAKLIFKLCTK